MNWKPYIRLYRLCVAYVWLLLCVNWMSCYIGMIENGWVSFLNVVLRSLNTALFVLSVKCSVSVCSSHFWCNVWKLLFLCSVHISYLISGNFFCALYTFLMYSMEMVVSEHSNHFWFTVQNVFMFLCTVHISDVQYGECSVSTHSTYFWCTVIYFLSNRFLIHGLCCLYCCVLILPYWRQFQYLCDM